jgi:hypothetical protein
MVKECLLSNTTGKIKLNLGIKQNQFYECVEKTHRIFHINEWQNVKPKAESDIHDIEKRNRNRFQCPKILSKSTRKHAKISKCFHVEESIIC